MPYITLPTTLVLQAIADGARYGFDIADKTGLQTGTVYPSLRRLESSGLVRSSWESDKVARREQRPARRYYGITKRGSDRARGRGEALRGSRPPPASPPACLTSCAASSRVCRGSSRRGAAASFEPSGRPSSPMRGRVVDAALVAGSATPRATRPRRGAGRVVLARQHWRPEMILQDIRFALRLMRLRAGYTAIVIVTLALSIGASTAMFSAIHAVLLRPLPFKEPSRLVKVWENDRLNQKPRYAVAPANYDDWRNQTHTFEQLAAYLTQGGSLAGSVGEPFHANVAVVTPNFFETLGVLPALGRPLTPPTVSRRTIAS